jgi:protein O-GlcNAc transferase
MGVRTVTIAGDRFCTRHSASHLKNAGLNELVADDLKGYLRIALDLAQDLEKLSQMRSAMREKILKSPLMEAERFGANFCRCLRDDVD